METSPVGIMVLPNTVLFPQALLPLHIFEPRYRHMLANCLENERMFAVALSKNEETPYPIAGLGLIRACVENADGTSNVILQGVSRIRLKQIAKKSPFLIRHYELLENIEVDTPEGDALAFKAIEYLKKCGNTGLQLPEGLVDFLENIHDPASLSDLLAFSFLDDITLRQSLLETLSVKDRLHELVLALQRLSEEPTFEP